jgi:hypothetical protein
MVYTYKERFNKKYKFPKGTSHSLKEIADITGYKLSGLKTIFDKGIGAFKTSSESVRPQVKSPEQWAFSRVYASVSPGSKSSIVDASHLEKRTKRRISP